MSSVLLVDDERPIRRTLSRWLARRGFEVECAANGSEALKLIDQAQFDVIVSDVNMPVMGGVEFLQHVLVVAPHVPVVLMSGSGDIASQEEAAALGAFAFLHKPLDLRSLEDIVCRALQSQIRPAAFRPLRHQG